MRLKFGKAKGQMRDHVARVWQDDMAKKIDSLTEWMFGEGCP